MAEDLPQHLRAGPHQGGLFRVLSLWVLGPLAFFFLCKGLGGTGWESASEHFISLWGKPQWRHWASWRLPCPRGFLPCCSVPTCPRPTSRRLSRRPWPAGTGRPSPASQGFGSGGPLCQGVSVFLYFFWKSVCNGKDHFVMVWHKASLIFAALAMDFVVFLFDQNIPSLLVTAMCSFHSSFCRLWAHMFYGHWYIYKYIDINIYEYIFLSFLHLEVAWTVRPACLYIVYRFCTPNSAALGKKKNAFLFPSHDICRYKRWKFFCKTKPWRRGGEVCVLLNLFLRNCTFYCKKNKKDYLNICHIKKKVYLALVTYQ